MSNIRALAQRTPEPASNVGQFLAKRGQLLMKEFRDFKKIKCDYGSSLTVTSLILSTAQAQVAERSYGVKLEHENRDQLSESGYLDFDELVELLQAIKYVIGVAKEIRGQNRDYTEFEYRTKEAIKVGFYHTAAADQVAFIDISPGGSMMFLTFEQLRDIFNAIKSAGEHLAANGAGSDANVTANNSFKSEPGTPR